MIDFMILVQILLQVQRNLNGFIYKGKKGTVERKKKKKSDTIHTNTQ